MEFRVYRYALPLASPFVFGHHELRERRGWLVELCDGTHSGWGEAAPLPGFSADSAGEVEEALATVRPEEAAESLPMSVRCALETAWCELEARRAGLPLAQWLDRTAALAVRCNATVGGGDIRLRRIRIAAAVREGYTTLKLKTGGLSWCDELDLLEEIATLYPGVSVRLDPNGLWTPDETESRLRSLRDLPVEYVEQPIDAGDVDGLLALARGPDGHRIAADESLLLGASALDRLLGPEGVRRIVLKPAALGGPLAALRIAGSGAWAGAGGGAWAGAGGASPARARWDAAMGNAHSEGRGACPARPPAESAACVVTTMLESAVGRAMAAHVAAAVDVRWGAAAHGLATGAMLARDVAVWPDAPELVLRGPGLGVVPEVSGLERVR